MRASSHPSTLAGPRSSAPATWRRSRSPRSVAWGRPSRSGRRCLRICRAPWRGRWGSPPPLTRQRPCVTAGAMQALLTASPPNGSSRRPWDAEPLRWRTRSGSMRAPASTSRSTKRPLRHAGSTELPLAEVDGTNRNTALASAMTEELARCGVRRAVLSPGSRSTPLAVALWRQPEIEVSVILDERSAGFFALGTALATGIPAAVLCTSGSAAANLHPAVVEADEAWVPMVVLTADRPPELRDIGAGQTIDQRKLYGEAGRWFSELGTHEADDEGLLHFRSVACRAHALALGDPRPGPVHLNVPWREPLAPIPVEGQVTATDPLALEGRGEAPLSAVRPA